MTLNRREFCTATSSFMALAMMAPVASTAFARNAQNAAKPFEYRALRKNTHLVLGGGGNVIVFNSTDGGILMVDALFAHTAPRLAATVEEIAGRQPNVLMNTHHHADHSGGNWQWNDAMIRVAHDNLAPRLEGNLASHVQRARQWLAQVKRGTSDAAVTADAEALFEKITALTVDQFKPSMSFSSTHTHSHGDSKITSHHFGNGHTDNDSVIHFEDENIVHMGDLLFHELHPYFDVGAGADFEGWQNALSKAYDLCDESTVVIPGHGEVTDRDGIQGMSRYFYQLREVVVAAKRAGKSREEVSAMTPDVFEGRGFAQMMSANLGHMFDRTD